MPALGHSTLAYAERAFPGGKSLGFLLRDLGFRFKAEGRRAWASLWTASGLKVGSLGRGLVGIRGSSGFRFQGRGLDPGSSPGLTAWQLSPGYFNSDVVSATAQDARCAKLITPRRHWLFIVPHRPGQVVLRASDTVTLQAGDVKKEKGITWQDEV